jgi:hypothetical protein
MDAILKWLADPINLTAISTAVIALFTIILAWVSICQGRLTRQSIDLARQEFTAAHPPKMIVHFIRMFPPRDNAAPDEQSIRVMLRIVNEGGSTAFVVGSFFRLDHYVHGEWPYPDDLVGQNLIGGTVDEPRRFVVGATDRFVISTDVHGGLIQAMGDVGEGEPILCLIGWIVYKDAAGASFTDYFCRERIMNTNRFGPAGGCDYES